ncbi:MAG: tRNA epoxyqueuosine(34) reductase QueG [Candidatus Latescibacterota bacterium]|nr:MAG: tRNA epoxyqueuosine(34) reductase QueG [Candidatus Latescibacterota bacterium]
MTKSSRSHHGAPGPGDRETFVRESALDVGFSLVGIADLVPDPESGRAFDRWIKAGRHGDMRYLSGGADKRHDPRLLLEGARSAVCVAVNYYSKSKIDRNRSAPSEGKGEVAIYAQGQDYHTVVGDMLGELDRRLKGRFAGMESRIVVDTQPISERDLAIRAGIGWLGKNTCVISPGYGSWIFLGELIINVPLRSDKPLDTLCGSCTACIDACPTGAIVEPFVIDANKCISYLTIEKRGDIPEDYHRSIGSRLFGCDTCQLVCPFNIAATESVLFGARDVNPIIKRPLTELTVIGNEEFEKFTRDSAISRCKPAGMRRNAFITAGNIARHYQRD